LPSLSEREQDIVRAMGQAIAKKLINAPLQHLREAGENARDVETLRRAFNLEDGSENRNGGAH
jgi:glutamyl-tRNA reductase